MGGIGKDYDDTHKKAREEFAVKLRKDKMQNALNSKRMKGLQAAIPDKTKETNDADMDFFKENKTKHHDLLFNDDSDDFTHDFKSRLR